MLNKVRRPGVRMARLNNPALIALTSGRSGALMPTL